MGNRKCKERYWKKVYEQASLVDCSCGCGQKTKSKDKYGRNKTFINGHNGRKYDDPKQYKREWDHRNKKQKYIYKLKWLTKLKVKLIEKLGSKCTKCGLQYNGKNGPVFDLHHKNPRTKKFNLNRNALNKVNSKRIMKELKKCILLCSNCHRIITCSSF